MNILFEDYYLLVLNKTAGLSAESGASRHPSAERWALEYFTRQLNEKSTSTRLKVTPFLRVAHRLDRAASGILVLAKTKTALTSVMAQFENREVEKIYVAQVSRPPKEQEGVLKNWLVKDPDSKQARIVEKQMRDAQLVELSYRVLEKRGAETLLEVRPKTGRYHQIRAQLAHAGMPISGDMLYGGRPWHENEIKLHALRLTLRHPKSGETIELEAPLPTHW